VNEEPCKSEKSIMNNVYKELTEKDIKLFVKARFEEVKIKNNHKSEIKPYKKLENSSSEKIISSTAFWLLAKCIDSK
jgi:hypothetical protein